MSEKDVIERTKRPNTVRSMKEQLAGLGIKRGEVILVHSSLSSIGWVCGGPQAVVTALLDSVGGGGTLVMPAHSGDWTDPSGWSNPPVPEDWVQTIRDNMPAFDKHITQTRGMGRIAEAFRSFPGTMRSDNPVVSFCANGRHAGHITGYHPIDDHFGIKTPLGKMYGLGARVLLLGVGYDSCTAFHLAETMVGNAPLGEKSGSAVMDGGKRKWVEFRVIEYESDDFPALGEAFERKNKVMKGKVGNADCTLLDMKESVDFAVGWLGENRDYRSMR